MKKNKYSTPLWVLATILAGMLSPMQSAVNGQLGHWLQDGNACAVISFASGLVVMFFIIMARKEIRQQFAAIPSLIKNRKVPLWNWFAGLCGAMVVFSEGASASALGVATFQTALISALLLSGFPETAGSTSGTDPVRGGIAEKPGYNGRGRFGTEKRDGPD